MTALYPATGTIAVIFFVFVVFVIQSYGRSPVDRKVVRHVVVGRIGVFGVILGRFQVGVRFVVILGSTVRLYSR